MSEPTSPGLVEYRKHCVDPAPTEVREPWLRLAQWVKQNVPQSQLIDVSLYLWRDLDPISQSALGTPEEVLADAIRDASDVTWYAMTEDSIAIFEKGIASLEKLSPKKEIPTA